MHFSATGLELAVQSTPLHKLQHLPTETWINLAIGVIGAVVVIRLWRTLRGLNDYAPYVAMAVFGFGVFCYWVYTRTEPAFLTPIVERLAPFFPSKSTQQEYIDKAHGNRDS